MPKKRSVNVDKNKPEEDEPLQNIRSYILGKETFLLLLLSGIFYISNMVYEYGIAYSFGYSFNLVSLNMNLLIANTINLWTIFFIIIFVVIKKIGKKNILSNLISIFSGLLGASLYTYYSVPTLDYISIIKFLAYFIFILLAIYLFLYLFDVLKMKNIINLLHGLCVFISIFAIMCFFVGFFKAESQTEFQSFSLDGKKYVLLRNYDSNIIGKEYSEGSLKEGFIYIPSSDLKTLYFSPLTLETEKK